MCDLGLENHVYTFTSKEKPTGPELGPHALALQGVFLKKVLFFHLFSVCYELKYIFLNPIFSLEKF